MLKQTAKPTSKTAHLPHSDHRLFPAQKWATKSQLVCAVDCSDIISEVCIDVVTIRNMLEEDKSAGSTEDHVYQTAQFITLFSNNCTRFPLNRQTCLPCVFYVFCGLTKVKL